MSPARVSAISPSRAWTRPRSSVTYRVCLTACECQALRADGVNLTALTRPREGSSPRAMTSMKTSPVNISAGPLAVGRLVSICTGTPSVSLRPRYRGRAAPRLPGEDLSARVGADVGDGPPASAGRGERHPDVPDLGAGQVHGGEQAGALAAGRGAPVHPVGADRDRVAARVVAGRNPGVEDDLPRGDRPAEVDLEVLPASLSRAGGVPGARVAVHRAGRRVGAGVCGRGPAGRGDLALVERTSRGATPGEGGQRPAGQRVGERLAALANPERGGVVVLVVRHQHGAAVGVAEGHVHDLPVP